MQFSCKTVSPDGTETIVLVSDPDFAADPMRSLADAGVGAVAVDKDGKDEAVGAQRQRLEQADGTGIQGRRRGRGRARGDSVTDV